MADTVQVMMEKMIPELEDLQERKLFSKDEIHQIVEKRRAFEYMMKRIPQRKIDALRYIEYELNLDALRQKRKERSGLQKTTIGDTAGVKRVHSIFDRVLYKHRGSVELWLQYVAFCKAQRSGRVLSHVFSRALQSHPRSPELWIEAASYEFSTNLNVESARVLMQRAIRINQGCQRLWHEYFRLELLYIQKLSFRREILKLDESASETVDTGASVLLEELPEEKQLAGTAGASDAAVVAAATDKQKARDAILQGAIPRVIYSSAIASIADDVAFRLRFVEISDLFGRKFAANLSQFVLDTCARDFGDSELVHEVAALRPFVVEADEAVAEQRAVQRFEASVAQLVGRVGMQEKFAAWLVARLAAGAKSAFLVAYAGTKLEELAETSSANAVRFVDFVHRAEGTNAAVAAVQRLLQKPLHTRSAQLWLLYAQLLLHQQPQAPRADAPVPKRRHTSTDSKKAATGSSVVAESIAVLEAALAVKLATSDYDGKFAVSTRLLQMLMGDLNTSASKVHATFEKALAAQERNSSNWSALRQQFVAWASSALDSAARVRQVYKTFLEGQLLPTDATYAFLLLCVDAERAAPDAAVAHARALFEKLVDLFGASREDAWVAYIRFFADRALYADAVQIHQRALRAWKDSAVLAQLSLTGGSS
ncbi:hypothetical protein PybrP1_006664 [[Pythium] brassicae (nom. inval.)]|nr:hypothetical protein PybrP1_006664 [[Pythium] brassicae (nom. inval.)]